MRDKHAASISLRSATYDEDGLRSDVALQVPGPSAGGTIPLAQQNFDNPCPSRGTYHPGLTFLPPLLGSSMKYRYKILQRLALGAAYEAPCSTEYWVLCP